MMLTSYRRSLEKRIMTGVIAAMMLARPAAGQFADVQVPENPVRGTQTNLFATWEGAEQMDGMIVQLPPGWSLVSASVLRDGYRPVPAQMERLDASRHRIIVQEPLTGRAEVVLGLEVGDSYAAERLEIIPLMRTGARLRSQRALAVNTTVRARDAAVDLENKVLSFASEQPAAIAFRRERDTDLHLRRPFSVSFWMKTAAVGEVTLSTWNGEDHVPYPLEIVVDPSGRLRAYQGRPGEHQSLGSKARIADGGWHHVTLSNDPEQGWMRLAIDGRNVDSLYAPVPPDIRMEQPLTLGGRADGAEPYFDGLRTFSGEIDELVLSTVESTGEQAVLRLNFEEPIPSDVLVGKPRGASRISSDRVASSDAIAVRVEYLADGIELSWSSSAERIREFVVERSENGHSFVELERLAPNDRGEYQVRDGSGNSGVVYYRVRQIYNGGMEHVSGTVKVGIGEEQPSSAAVLGNYPNPFHALTTITYEVRKLTDIQLAVWDLSGQPVQLLVDRQQNAGIYQARFDADGLPSGTYFVRLRTPAGVESHKMILAK